MEDGGPGDSGPGISMKFLHIIIKDEILIDLFLAKMSNLNNPRQSYGHKSV